MGGRKVVWAAQLSMTSSSGSSSCYLSSSRQSWNDAAVCKCEFPSASTHWWLFVCVRERGRKKAVRVGLFDWAIIFSTKLSDTKKKKVTKDVKRTFLLKPAPGRQPDSSLALYSCAQSKTHMMAALQQTFFFFFAGALLKKKKKQYLTLTTMQMRCTPSCATQVVYEFFFFLFCFQCVPCL